MFFKKVKLTKQFEFGYKMRVIGKHGHATTDEFQAVVKAESLSEAKKKLQKELMKKYELQVLITHPIEESR